MITESIAISELAKTDPEAAWKCLSRIYGKGEPEHISEALQSLPASIMEFPEGPTKYRDLFFGKLIKNTEVELLSTLLSKAPDPQQFRKEMQIRQFGNVCEARDNEIVQLIFPESVPVEFDHKHWTTAVLRKSIPLLNRMNFPVEPKRALILIENYFFDLQLAQLKYLEPHIPADQWPMRFAANAITRCKGPGVINFFADHAFRSAKISQGELWDSLAAAIKGGNAKAFQRLADGADKIHFDWKKTGPAGDITLGEEGSEAIRLSSSKFPPEARKCSLIDLAVLRGDVALAQEIVTRTGAALPDERFALLEEAVKAQLKTARTPADKSKLVLAKMRAVHDITAMQEAAAVREPAKPHPKAV